MQQITFSFTRIYLHICKSIFVVVVIVELLKPTSCGSLKTNKTLAKRREVTSTPPPRPPVPNFHPCLQSLCCH